MNPIPLNLVFEDQISEYVMLKVTDGLRKFSIGYSYSEGGFGYIKNNINGFNEASKGCPFFILTDLDVQDCAPNLIKSWINIPISRNLLFRVAVREVEAWLLADIEGFSTYIGVSPIHFNASPEQIGNPKSELFRVVSRSRKKQIKQDILPKDRFARIGPNYNERLGEFVLNYWDVNRAMHRSTSLKRTIHCLATFQI
ncbi:MAG: hypothetical protein ABIJ04_12740 [Bacteroidota bacterium]